MLAIAPECDLAILTVNDGEFWKGVKPVEFRDMPSPGEKAIVTRYREDRDYLPPMTVRVLGLGMTRYSFSGTIQNGIQGSSEKNTTNRFEQSQPIFAIYINFK
ncbi:hypothetical protein Vadar_020309 [Vaccinium darrowii]|uniref:Uncharacterized protein n=1 Tax=Vaccinium darrowii TaxID=229202 RepID=A0ACB7YH02_9ERIC|nr:hypothetical protein Vadar_020309 [Vaccinium darrowii]